MSPLLFRIGRACVKHARLVVMIWVILLAGLGVAAYTVGGKLNNDFNIPATEAQQGLDQLNQRFPEFSGTTAQIVFTTSDNRPIAAYRSEIAQFMHEVAALPDVAAATGPFDPNLPRPSVSSNGRAALGQVNFTFSFDQIPAHIKTDLAAIKSPAAGLQVHVGGQLYSMTEVPLSPNELIGVAIALLVLWITFRSWKAAITPILTAAAGVGLTMSLMFLAARFCAVSTTTPALAVMLGLAVGIDYALFIVFRHRSQLANGATVANSVAHAVGTSGSAVIFAGSTVIIALLGLAVAQIPFLTIMGVVAAFAVAFEVIGAVTLLPALLTLWGEGLRPRKEQSVRKQKWVRITTRFPIPIVAIVLVFAAFVSFPATQMRIALPGNATAPYGSHARTTYDLIAKEFGPGANGPIIITADIVQSQDPLGLMKRWEQQVARVPGIASIQLATPNRDADMGVIIAIPTTAVSSPATEALVHRLRADAPQWATQLGIENIRVTGVTAAAIDVSQQLGKAVLPFTLLVVGLSMILLLVVFRSLWIPVKATVGYLVSVGAAFGATTVVFLWGWGNSFLRIGQVGPVISFMPIMVMGVLFGLAMDYEVFLVSRMREEFVHGAQPLAAIRKGYDASAPVVTAAALIMISVFAGFVPDGAFEIQPIAFGLALGVFVDAFIVRMTLVPAVMALLGKNAWYLPKWLDRVLPRLDIEGAALDRRMANERIAQQGEAAIIRIDSTPPVLVAPGQVVRLRGSEEALARLVDAICGRGKYPERITVAGYDTCDEAAQVQARTCVLDLSRYVPTQLDEATKQARRGKAQVIIVREGIHPDSEQLAQVLRAGGAVLYWSPESTHCKEVKWQVEV